MSTIDSTATPRPATPRPAGAQPTGAGSAEPEATTPAGPAEPERAAAAELLPMIWGIHISRAVYVVAELGLADRLADGPVSSAELSRATGTHEPSLYGVLRLLAALGVFEGHETRHFSLTLLGDRLRSEAPAGMRSWATFLEVRLTDHHERGRQPAAPAAPRPPPPVRSVGSGFHR